MKVLLGIYFTENAKIRYGVEAKIRLGWGFIPSIMLKAVTTEDLIHSKDQNKVRLEIYSIEMAKIRFGWGFVSLKRQCSETDVVVRQKRKIFLFPELQVMKKIFTPAAAKFFFFINLIEFFK